MTWIGWGECWARLWRTVLLACAMALCWPAAVVVAHWMFWWWWYFVPVVLLAGAGGIWVHDWVLWGRYQRQVANRFRIRGELESGSR